MSNFKEILTNRISGVEEMQQKRSETIKGYHVPEMIDFLAEYLNNNEGDPFSLAIAEIWGSEIKPRNFTTEVYFFPKAKQTSVCLCGEIKRDLFEKNSNWYKKGGGSYKILRVSTLFSDPEKLSLEIRKIKTKRGFVSGMGGEVDRFVNGSAQEFELTENLSPEELLEEIVDLVIDPKKEPLGTYPLSYTTI